MNTRRALNGWVIVTREGRKLRCLPEGPWENRDGAQFFAAYEVGVPYSLEQVKFADGKHVYVTDHIKGNEYIAPNGEVFTLRRIAMLEGWEF